LKDLDIIKENSEQFISYDWYKKYSMDLLGADGFTRYKILKLQEKWDHIRSLSSESSASIESSPSLPIEVKDWIKPFSRINKLMILLQTN
jgi:hypothetical protein